MTTTIISSIDRSIGTNVNGTITFSSNNKLSGTFKIKEFIMLNSLYNVNNKNNKIYFTESATSRIGTLTNGSYIFSELAANIKDSMETAGVLDYTITYDFNTNKFNFAATGDFAFEFATISTNGSHFLLGISNTVNTVESAIKTSDKVADITPNKLIFLSFPDASNSMTLSNGVQTSLYISTLRDFGDIFRKNYGADDIKLSFNAKITVTYRLHDKNGDDLINTNGSDWTLILVKE